MMMAMSNDQFKWPPDAPRPPSRWGLLFVIVSYMWYAIVVIVVVGSVLLMLANP